MAVTEYMAIHCQRHEDLAPLVNAAIAEGWQPYGSLVMLEPSETAFPTLVQPMIKGTP
jgi:hypothetical protein